ncbi:MAG: carboxypeptidase-like regulatory domain-containing protein, partial [Candidatus Heimdallarchaeota archaeon]|nr:carboxypeptidase-like regulatory domain-containing protein [Candidatus Heimdallarchaeota archaeon]
MSHRNSIIIYYFAFNKRGKEVIYFQRKIFIVFILCLQLFLWMSAYAQNSTGKNIIHGFINDKSTGEPIPYGNVWLENTQLGSATDVHGYYVINGIPAGEYKLMVSILGYKHTEKQIKVRSKGKKRFDLELVREALETETVVVTAERTRFQEDIEISSINIRPKDISITPSFIEADVFRTIQQLPSVTSQNDFSSALVVRGGSPDENLILLDGAEIYNPYHLIGLFSTFNADAISDAEFLAGGYSAEHTGRLSSILNITSREGNSKQGRFFKDSKFGEYWDLSRVKTEISLLSSRAMAEGPFYKGAWILSGRRTYFDIIADLAGKGRDWA